MITDGMIDIRLNEMLLAFEKSPDHNFSRFAARRELERETARPEDVEEIVEIISDVFQRDRGEEESIFSRTARAIIARYGAPPATAPELTEDRVAELARESSIVHSSTPFANGEDFKAVVRHIAAALRASAEPPKPDPVKIGLDTLPVDLLADWGDDIRGAIRAGIAADREARV